MTYYARQGNRYRQTVNIPEHTALPTGTYVLKQDIHGFFYEQIDNYDLPPKVYGDLTKNRDRIITTFLSRSQATGVMLAGEKGSGKTLLGKALSIELCNQDIPTIVINTPFCGDEFNSLIQEMEQPALIFFDEFEKTYDEAHQEAVLTLLDGVYPTKKLFVITTNDKWRIDRHMRNRPGRIFYMLDFKGLDAAFIREYAEDNLDDPTKVDSVCLVSNLFSEFNFDMLKALVEEMNRYKETAQEAMQILNAKPEFEGQREYSVRLWIDGGANEIKRPFLQQVSWTGNPITGRVQIGFFAKASAKVLDYHQVEVEADLGADTEHHDEDYDTDENYDESVHDEVVPTNHDIQRLYHAGKLTHTQAIFTPADIKKVDGDGVFYYKNASGQTLQLSKKFRPQVDYWDALK